MTRKTLPKDGLSETDIMNYLEKSKQNDVKWRDGKCWCLSYWHSDQHESLTQKAFNLYSYENMASPSAFPSTLKLEQDILAIITELLNGDENVSGNVTSGGTESNLLAIKAYRDFSRKHKPSIKRPEMLLPASAHPSFLKAADYFDIDVKTIPLKSDYKVDLDLLKKAISKKTMLIVASAPNLYYGVSDEIAEIAEIALSNAVPLHIDACLGGLFFPFLKDGENEAPRFDFQVPGVSSITVDIHKYGFSLKGLSAILYKDSNFHHFQYYVNTTHTNTSFGSTVLQGSRSAGALAAGWASLCALGKVGFEAIVAELKKTSLFMINEINKIDGLFVLGEPEMSVFSFSSEQLNIFSIWRRLLNKGWYLERQMDPESIRLVVMPIHFEKVNTFLADLREAVDKEQSDPLVDTSDEKPFLYGTPDL